MEPDLDTLMFFDGHSGVLPLYEQLETLLYQEFPEVHKRVQKTQITFTNRHVFACVSFARVKRKAELPENYLVLTLGLQAPLDSPRVAVKTEPYPGHWTHHFVLSRPEDLDEELLSWIRESYSLPAKNDNKRSRRRLNTARRERLFMRQVPQFLHRCRQGNGPLGAEEGTKVKSPKTC